MKIKRKPIRKVSQKGKLFKECNKLWSECVKLRSANRSELSGKSECLHSHHISGKSSYALRFSLDNGICLTAGEHFYVAHNAGRYEEFRKKIQNLRGTDIFEKLEQLKWCQPKVDLMLTKIYLQIKIKEFKENEKK